MIQISESAQTHFRKLIERESLPGLGVKLSAVHPGTAKADVRLEFAEPADLGGDEWAVDCEGFTLWLDAGSVKFLDGAEIDYETQATGGQLQIRAPKIKGQAPADGASLVERVQWVVEQGGGFNDAAASVLCKRKTLSTLMRIGACGERTGAVAARTFSLRALRQTERTPASPASSRSC